LSVRKKKVIGFRREIRFWKKLRGRSNKEKEKKKEGRTRKKRKGEGSFFDGKRRERIKEGKGGN